MIKKLLLTLSTASLFGVTSKAQTFQPCGTTEVYLQQLALRPDIAMKEAQLNEYIREKLASTDISRFAKTTDDGSVIYDIPIVFHIIHDYGAEYLPDADIVQCVSDINKMYHKQNTDTAEVIAPFKGFINNSNQRYIGKANITWHLATVDPDGKPTNGITRRQSYLSKNGGDQAKFDLWSPSNYMNVWVVNLMPGHGGAAAYAYQPPTADAIPYYDGVISLYDYVNRDNTISHELGHELNLAHPWGNTNNPEVSCGDDDVDDTPPTKGHSPSTGCNYTPTSKMWDTLCINSTKGIAKLRVDTVTVGTVSVLPQSDTSTVKGITFSSRTVTSLDSVDFYPTAAIGSSYTIALTKNNVVINTKTVLSTVVNSAQTVALNFTVPGGGDTNAIYSLRFNQNAGALKDTVVSGLSSYPYGTNGAILIKTLSTNGYYNFFYNWRVKYGYFKIYPGVRTRDSLVDYPDTTNAQNVMDYTYCSKMFTYGQTQRMRAALTSDVAKRDSLWSPSNLAKTGALSATPAMTPKAAYSIEKGLYVTEAGPTYFMTAGAASQFKLMNRTWRATATSINWTLSNGSTTPTSTSTGSFTTQFATPGWATITMIATNANGSDTFGTSPILDPVTGSYTGNTSNIYVADPTAVNPIGYYQEFNPGGDLDKWPIFNYYNNRFKWEVVNTAGYYDRTSIRYRSFDDRAYPANLTGDPNGDKDDFFTPAFDLSSLGTNGNVNFMMAGAYSTSDPRYMKDTLTIAYSKDSGRTWTTLKVMGGAQLQTVGVATKPGTEYTPSYTDWQPVSIDLKNGTTPIRDPKVYFRFRYRPYGKPVGNAMVETANNFYLDRFNISNNPLSVNEMVLGERNAAVAPNPTTSNAYVLFKAANAHVNIQVTDITGKVVYTVAQRVDANNARIEIPAASIQVKGMYLVHITGDDNMNQTEKLVVY
jgi:hypothetical protein